MTSFLERDEFMISQYTIKARSAERKFLRYLKKHKYFHTVKGNINYLVDISNKYIVIRSSRRRMDIQLSRQQFRKSIQYVWSYRTATRKGLEAFTNYTSALLGILFKVFHDLCFVKTLKSGLMRLTLKGVRFFASGLERSPSDRRILKEVGGHFLLLNYFQLRSNKRWTSILEDENFFCYIDSGGYSVYNFIQKEKQRNSEGHQQSLFSPEEVPLITVEEYANFVNKHSGNPRILGFFNLDVFGDGVQTKKNFNYLRKNCPNAKLFPVWQVTDSIEELEELVQRVEPHEVIGIGGLVPFLSNRQEKVRKILHQVFERHPEENFHFLGGANRMLKEFQWFSSDSTAFLNSRKSTEQRKVYTAHGIRVAAPEELTTEQIIKQNLSFLVKLESINLNQQLSLRIG
jgi:hypothetical protein